MTMSQEIGSFRPDQLIAGGFPLTTETIKLATGSLKRGAVLGRILYSVATSVSVDAGDTGNGTVTEIRPRKQFKYGTYNVTCVEAPVELHHQGIFTITDPDGIVIGSVRIPVGAGKSVVFSNEQIQLKITEGTTDFAANDNFSVAVNRGVPSTGTLTGIGNGTLAQVEGHLDLKSGNYAVTCIEAATNGGRFKVEDPAGNIIGYTNTSKKVGTGNGTVTEIKAGPLFKRNGPYVIKCTTAATHGGTFTVYDPDGNVLGTVTISAGAGNSAVFWHEQISFKITDGSTDFAANDTFTLYWYEGTHLGFVIWDGATDFIKGDTFAIAVTIAGESAKIVDSGNNDGSQWPALVLAEDCDASVSAQSCASYKTGTFNAGELYFGGDDTIETHRREMELVGLKTVRAQEIE